VAFYLPFHLAFCSITSSAIGLINAMVNCVDQVVFKFQPTEVGRYTQYWQLSMEPGLAACSDAAKVTHKFELCGKVSILLIAGLNIVDFLSMLSFLCGRL